MASKRLAYADKDRALYAGWQDGYDRKVEKVGFGINDERGREIGAELECWTIKLLPQSEGREDGWNSTIGYVPGEYWCFCPQALRNGKKYGALQREQFFDSARERDAAAAKYLANAKKRAAKRAQGGN